MKKLYIVANWKSHMKTSEANGWLQEISNLKSQISNNGEKEIVVCPPFTLLQNLKYKIDTFSSQIKVGGQNVSPYEEGAYTGEIAASMLSEFCNYVIIGHSERREHFGENDAMLSEKVEQAIKHKLTPIYCVQDEKTKIPEGVTIVAYEPVFAIGTGKADTPENAEMVIEKIKDGNTKLAAVLYGGSVDPSNVRSFTGKNAIDGVLVGTASLDAEKFVAIIQNA